MTWIPNLLTGMNLFLGFWAIIQALEGNILTACWLVIIASVCDGLDGKLARFMNRSTEMGLELDSLADVVSFGAAPGVILYVASFRELEFLGLILAALPLIFGAIRLARYNLTAVPGERRALYVGLPIPMQANTLATFIIFNYALWGALHLEILLLPLVWLLSLLMVSHFPYDRIPRFSIKEAVRRPWRLIVSIVIVGILALKPAIAFFPILMLYVLRGVIMAAFRFAPAEEEEELDSELEVK
ncbi:MAG TPA: CDP-diacylglycerol--serine O-phosphatidyltransferase [bacterium]